MVKKGIGKVRKVTGIILAFTGFGLWYCSAAVLVLAAYISGVTDLPEYEFFKNWTLHPIEMLETVMEEEAE